MISIVSRIVVFVAGVLLVAVGIVGLFLPFLQGILLIALGLSVMSLASERIAGYVDALKRRARALWRGKKGEPSRENGNPA